MGYVTFQLQFICVSNFYNYDSFSVYVVGLALSDTEFVE